MFFFSWGSKSEEVNQSQIQIFPCFQKETCGTSAEIMVHMHAHKITKRQVVDILMQTFFWPPFFKSLHSFCSREMLTQRWHSLHHQPKNCCNTHLKRSCTQHKLLEYAISTVQTYKSYLLCICIEWYCDIKITINNQCRYACNHYFIHSVCILGSQIEVMLVPESERL